MSYDFITKNVVKIISHKGANMSLALAKYMRTFVS